MYKMIRRRFITCTNTDTQSDRERERENMDSIINNKDMEITSEQVNT